MTPTEHLAHGTFLRPRTALIGFATFFATVALGSSATALESSPAPSSPTPTPEASASPSPMPGTALGETAVVSVTSAFAGDTVTVTGNCAVEGYPYPSGAYVILAPTWDAGTANLFAEEPVDSTGAFEIAFTVPTEFAPGPYLLAKSCRSDDQLFDEVVIDFTVLGDGGPTTAPSPEPSPSASPTSEPSATPVTTIDTETPVTNEDELAETGGNVSPLWTLAGLCGAIGAALIWKRRTQRPTLS